MPATKKYLLLTCLGIGMAMHSASASISAAATPTTQQVSAGGMFSVSLSLTVTGAAGDPANVTAFDLYLVTASGNSGDFTLTSATGAGVFTASGPNDAGGDPLNNPAAKGFVINGLDQGFSASSAQTTPLTQAPLESLTLTVSPSTPAGTYTLATSTATTAGNLYSDVSDSNGNVFEITNAGTFMSYRGP